MSAKEDEDEVEGELSVDCNPAPDQPTSLPRSLSLVSLPGHAFDPSMVDVGRIARWSVSSHKYGHDVIKLRDDSPDTFWQ